MVARTRSNVKTTKWASIDKKVTGPGSTPGGGPVSSAHFDFYRDEGGVMQDSVDIVRTALYKNRKRHNLDYGSECSLQKKVIDSSGWKQNLSFSDSFGSFPSFYRQDWSGTRVPLPFFTTHPFSRDPTPGSPFLESQMDAWGTIGVNRAYPIKRQLSLAQTMAELKREGLPRISGIQLGKALPSHSIKELPGTISAVGGEYLNFQFGIRPILSDLQDLILYDDSLADRLLELRRTKKSIHRKSTVLEDIVNVTKSSTDLSPQLSFFESKYGGGLGAVKVVEKSTTNVWFSGEFQFLYPPPLRSIPGLEQTKEIMFKAGLEPSSELIWQLQPWSWLVDWETSVGEAFSNSARFSIDHAVMRYGYVMYRKETTWSYSNPFFGELKVKAINFQRRRANPFGFGVTFSSLTEKQWSILAALGLSRGRSVRLGRP